MSARAVATIRRWDAKITAEHGPEALWLACSHGDVIKAIVADALGLHLDQFQRIVADPGIDQRHPVHPGPAVRGAGQRLRRPGFAGARQTRPKAARPARGQSDAAVGGGAGRTGLTRLRDRRVTAGRVPVAPMANQNRWDGRSWAGLDRVDGMTHQVHSFEPPERFVAGTVGEPGDRTFFLQARGGGRVITSRWRRSRCRCSPRSSRSCSSRPTSGSGSTCPRRRCSAGTTTSRSTPPSTRSSGSAPSGLAFDVDTSTVVIEAIEAGEAEVEIELGEDDPDDAVDEDERRRRARRRPRPAPGAAHAPRPPARSSTGPAAWSPPAGHRARSAASRSTRPATSAPGTTATTGDHRAGLSARRERCARPAHSAGGSTSRAGWWTPPTRRCAPRSPWTG